MSDNPDKGTLIVSDITTALTAVASQSQRTAFICQPHDELIKSLLAQVQKVDFRERAGFDPDDDDAKLKKPHYLIITVEEVLKLAEKTIGIYAAVTVFSIPITGHFGNLSGKTN